jgi:type II secretory pathway component HofQ
MSLSGATLIVGAPFEDSAAIGVNGVPTSTKIPNSGAVYVFDNSEGQ